MVLIQHIEDCLHLQVLCRRSEQIQYSTDTDFIQVFLNPLERKQEMQHKVEDVKFMFLV